MTDKLNDAESAVTEAELALAEAEELAAAAAKAVAEAQAARDAALIERDGEPDPRQDQIDRMAYIRAQNVQRAKAAGVEFVDANDADPLDHDGNGAKGGSLPKAQRASKKAAE